MIEIDGSFGEGGGQIIRCAVALSAIFQKDIKIINIRKNRPKPGLFAQHFMAIQTVGKITNAKIDGLKLESTEISFYPKKIKGDKFSVDIGTAGSITLLIQCILPVAIFAKESTKIDIKGGTDVSWSPPIDFLKYVLLPALRLFGVDSEIEVIKRGYYPKGGGHVKMTINPSNLVGQRFKRSEVEGKLCGISHSSRLKESVTYRQAKAAKEYLNQAGYDSKIDLECQNSFSTGSGIAIWAKNKSGNSLGKKGKTSEDVGKEAANMLISELKSKSSVGEFLSDQLIPYMALAEGESEFSVKRLTEHAKTSIWVAEKFLDVSFRVSEGDVFYVGIKNH